MGKIVNWLNESRYISLYQCMFNVRRGLKNGVTYNRIMPCICFYCPLSKKKMEKIKFSLMNGNYLLKMIHKNYLEAEYINAKGAGITGGDPLLNGKEPKNI